MPCPRSLPKGVGIPGPRSLTGGGYDWSLVPSWGNMPGAPAGIYTLEGLMSVGGRSGKVHPRS